MGFGVANKIFTTHIPKSLPVQLNVVPDRVSKNRFRLTANSSSAFLSSFSFFSEPGVRGKGRLEGFPIEFGEVGSLRLFARNGWIVTHRDRASLSIRGRVTLAPAGRASH